jgi:hypothetical protein
MSDEQQLDDSDFGIRGLEKAAGFKEMVLADAPPQEDLALDASVENFVASRDDPAPGVERAFFDVQTGEPRPSNETVSAEDAARNLSNVREAERRALEAELNRATQEAIDQLRAPEPQPVTLDAGHDEQQKPPIVETQPEQQPGSRLEQALRNDPQLLGEVTQYAEAVRQNGEQAVGAAAAAMTWNAQLAASAILGDVPELQGLNNAQIPVALQMLAQKNPQRAAEIQGKLSNLNTLAGQAQQAQRAAAESAQQRFSEWSQLEDQKFEIAAHTLAPGLSPEKIKAQARETVRAAGISDREMAQLWSHNPLFRSSAAQTLMAKAAAFDLLMQERVAQKTEIAHKRTASVPNVQRPGVSLPERPMEAGQRLPQKFANAKDAANWLSARRAAR